MGRLLRKSRELLSLVELAGEELLQLGEHLGGVFAGGEELDLGAFAGGEHHQAHDGFAVHLLLVLFDEDVGFELVGDAHDHRGRAGMDAHFVLNNQLFGVLLAGRGGVDFVHRFGE